MKIRRRGDWGARAPRSRMLQSPSAVREMFLHWPGDGQFKQIDTVEEERAFMRSIQDFHMNARGWSDFAYNFAVFPSGRVYRGRGMNVVPAAQAGRNTGTVAVLCVLGPSEKVTRAMRRSLGALKEKMDRKAGRDLPVRPHSAVTSTTCPGPAVRGIIDDLNRRG